MYESANGSGPLLGMLPLVVMFGLYAFWSWTQMKMAQNLGLKSQAWWAWIPVLSWYLLCKMAAKPDWWFILCFVPGVNLVVFVILYAQVAKSLGLSAAWGVVAVLVPIINLFAVAKMALAQPPSKFSPPPSARPWAGEEAAGPARRFGSSGT